MIHKTILISLLLLLPLSVPAAIYKWVDAQGNTHYDQEKPLEVDAEKIKLAPSPAGSTSTYSKPSLKPREDKNAASEDNVDDAQSKEMIPKKERAKLCARAKETLKKISEAGRVRTKNKDGSTQVMSEQQKQDRINQEKKAVKQHCS
ncbi:MAG: DUF4124 domain-containing protein [Gammaproteobacteria bacterium]|nr:DUF4124 domain-containing protein [Gammaproteobacteria bacterium]